MNERFKTVVTSGDIALCRQSNGLYKLEITDTLSRRASIEVSLTADQVAKMVTGAYASDVKISCRRPDLIGKKRVKEDRQVLCPLKTYSKETLENWLMENYHEVGWDVDTYLGSQNSVKSVDGGSLLNFKVERWIDE